MNWIDRQPNDCETIDLRSFWQTGALISNDHDFVPFRGEAFRLFKNSRVMCAPIANKHKNPQSRRRAVLCMHFTRERGRLKLAGHG
jgi:hypothetical protein